MSKNTHEILEHPLLGKIIRKIKEDEVDEDDWEWMEGKLKISKNTIILRRQVYTAIF